MPKPKYYYLKPSDIIRAGDEFESWGIWLKIKDEIIVGEKRGDVFFHGGRVRRRVDENHND